MFVEEKIDTYELYLENDVHGMRRTIKIQNSCQLSGGDGDVMVMVMVMVMGW